MPARERRSELGSTDLEEDHDGHAIPRKIQEILKLNRFPITHETSPDESPYAALK
jgi:hypothetical protein